MATNNDEAERVRTLLRTVQYPGFKRDIVAAGFIKDVEAQGKQVTVHFAPTTRIRSKVELMETEIRKALRGAGGFERVEIARHQASADAVLSNGGGMTPLQAEMIEDGLVPEADIMRRSMQRPNMAPLAGYDEDGPAPFDGPLDDTYHGDLPVLQWQIDPHDPAAKSGTANLKIGEWEFRVWWQVHTERFVYASIQAMRDDRVEHGGTARAHPVGRSDAVNLVYDMDRKAVVAIYGTVRDFRPFVDAFYRGFVLKN